MMTKDSKPGHPGLDVIWTVDEERQELDHQRCDTMGCNFKCTACAETVSGLLQEPMLQPTQTHLCSSLFGSTTQSGRGRLRVA